MLCLKWCQAFDLFDLLLGMQIVPITGLYRLSNTEYGFFCMTVCSSYPVNSLLLLAV